MRNVVLVCLLALSICFLAGCDETRYKGTVINKSVQGGGTAYTKTATINGEPMTYVYTYGEINYYVTVSVKTGTTTSDNTVHVPKEVYEKINVGDTVDLPEW